MSKRMKFFSCLASHVSCMGALAVCSPSVCLAAAQQPSVALPPLVVTGRVVDYEGSGIKSAEVRVRKGTTLLARASVGAFDADTSANYAVAVPMSNVDADTTACVGDRLSVEVDDGSSTYSNTNAVITATGPGDVVKLNLRAASCTNPYGVSDQYLADVTDWANVYGYDGFLDANGNYQPNADYDGDGVSNYNEYLAGSDPFDPNDAGLKILSWGPVEGDDTLMEATFLASRNRVYSAERAGQGEGGGIGPFVLTSHRESPDSATERNYLTTNDSDPEIRAIYLYKESASGLYRLRLE